MIEVAGGESKSKEHGNEDAALIDRHKYGVAEQKVKNAANEMRQGRRDRGPFGVEPWVRVKKSKRGDYYGNDDDA